MRCLQRSFYHDATEHVAMNLIGKTLVRLIRKGNKLRALRGMIVETEAYGFRNDPASHAFQGITPRNAVMFGEVGKAYIYFCYGNHFCFNITARIPTFKAGAVLIRAVQPLEGIGIMRDFRKIYDDSLLTKGPGRLTQAMDISCANSGQDVTVSESDVHVTGGADPPAIISSKRIGISKGVDKEWRYVFAYRDKDRLIQSTYASTGR
jgi:DNA-3-methyladenine glycosylase